MAAYYAVLIHYEGEETLTENQTETSNCLDVTFKYTSIMFLELAILLNISKWVYFFLVAQTHRNIRYHEISMEL